MRWLYWFMYRAVMRLAHRHGWHHMKHCNPQPPHPELPDGFMRCDWCGIHSDIPWTMRAKKVEAMIARSALETKP